MTLHIKNDSSKLWLFAKKNFRFRKVFAPLPVNTHTMQTQTIQRLVQTKTHLDQAARAIQIFEYTTFETVLSGHNHTIEEMRIIEGMKRNLNDSQQAFEAQVAALSEETRWQFMLQCMLTGALDD